MQNVSKRTILWIVPLIIIGIFWYFYGPQDEITDNEYISYIKEMKINESDSETLDEAFTNYCETGQWVYFQTQKNQHVVEYKGTCPVNDKMNDVNLQFVVEKDQSNYDKGVLLLNGVQQAAEQRDEFLQTVAKK